MVLAPLSVSVLLLAESVCVPLVPPRERLFTVAFVSRVTVYVPTVVIIALSFVPGACPQLQLAAVLQFPPAAFVQLHVPATPLPLMETAADGVTGSFEFTVKVVLFEPADDGWNVTTAVQFDPGVRVLGYVLPHGDAPPFRFNV